MTGEAPSSGKWRCAIRSGSPASCRSTRRMWRARRPTRSRSCAAATASACISSQFQRPDREADRFFADNVDRLFDAFLRAPLPRAPRAARIRGRRRQRPGQARSRPRRLCRQLRSGEGSPGAHHVGRGAAGLRRRLQANRIHRRNQLVSQHHPQLGELSRTRRDRARAGADDHGRTGPGSDASLRGPHGTVSFPNSPNISCATAAIGPRKKSRKRSARQSSTGAGGSCEDNENALFGFTRPNFRWRFGRNACVFSPMVEARP